jgi:hypothetical protein
MAKLGSATAVAKGGSTKAKVIGGLILLVILIIVLFNIFNFTSTDTNRIGLHYGGGVVEAKKFKSIIPPGSTNKLIGPGDTLYTYPIDQRSYIIGGDAADTDAADEVTVVSKDNVRLGVRVQVYFTLNRDKDVIKSFHERIGLKTEAYEERGWNDMLQSYFRPQIDRALAAVATNYGWAELYNNESKKATFQTAAAQEFTRLLPAAVGGDYFCGPSYNGSNDCGELHDPEADAAGQGHHRRPGGQAARRAGQGHPGAEEPAGQRRAAVGQAAGRDARRTGLPAEDRDRVGQDPVHGHPAERQRQHPGADHAHHAANHRTTTLTP